MYKFTIIVLGKYKETAFKELEHEYLKRLRPYAKVKIVELQEVPYKTSNEIDKIRAKEAEIIRKALPKDGIVILLAEKGTLRDSENFAEFIARIGSIGQEIVFVLGSGVGLHSSLKEVSNYQISLSPLTYTHNFARVLLEEQLYRACTIIYGKEYHK